VRNIVILGAGFGGISVAKNLIGKLPDDFRIILVDKNSHHTFHASLYEVATASLGKRLPQRIDFENLYTSAILDIREIFKKRGQFEFIKAQVSNVNFKERKVFFKNRESVNFAYLIFALGSETNFFGIPGLEEKALPLKDTNEALNIRNAIQEVFERKQPNQRITIIIGGGGFTGCEFASELVFYLKKLSKEFGHLKERVKVTVIEASDTILPGASDWVKKAAKRRMEELEIDILFGKPISKIEDSTVLLKTGEKLYFDVFIWTAGVKANSLLEKISGVTLEKECRVLSDDCLRIVPYNNIFGVGDNLYCFDPALQTPMPATAFAAIEQGKIVARNILNDIYKKKAMKCKSLPSPRLIIPLGGKFAIVDIGPLKLKGFFGWLVKEFTNLKYYLSVLSFIPAFKLWLRGVRIYTRND